MITTVNGEAVRIVLAGALEAVDVPSQFLPRALLFAAVSKRFIDMDSPVDGLDIHGMTFEAAMAQWPSGSDRRRSASRGTPQRATRRDRRPPCFLER